MSYFPSDLKGVERQAKRSRSAALGEDGLGEKKERVLVVCPLVGDRTALTCSLAPRNFEIIFFDVFGRQPNSVKGLLERSFDVLAYVKACTEVVRGNDISAVVYTHEFGALVAAAVGEELRKLGTELALPSFDSVARVVHKGFTPLRGCVLSDHSGRLTERSGGAAAKLVVKSWKVGLLPAMASGPGDDAQMVEAEKNRVDQLGELKFPVIAKPASLTSGLHTYKCHDRDELELALRNADVQVPPLTAMHRTLMEHYCSAPLLEQGIAKPTMIVESYVSNATLHTVEGWSNEEGDLRCYSVGDTTFFSNRATVIDTFVLPSQLPSKATEQVVNAAKRAVDSLDGFTSTFWNVELWRMANGNFVLLEVNAGTAGMHSLFAGNFGCDLLTAVSQVALGRDVRKSVPLELVQRGASSNVCGRVYVHTFAEAQAASSLLRFDRAWIIPSIDLFMASDDQVEQDTGGRGRILASFELYATSTRELAQAANRIRSELLIMPEMSAPQYVPSGPQPHVLDVMVVAPIGRDKSQLEKLSASNSRYVFHYIELPGGTPPTGDFELSDAISYVDACIHYYKQHKIDIVLYTHDFASVCAGALQKEMELDTLPTMDSIFMAMHKFYSRNVQSGFKLKQCSFSMDRQTIDSAIEEVGKVIGFPAYVKPPCLVLSQGQFVVRDPDALKRAVKQVHDFVVKKSKPLAQVFQRYIDMNTFPLVTDLSTMCAEELVNNAVQHCVEGYSDANGECHVWAVWDQNYYSHGGHMAVDSYSTPSRLNSKEQREIIEVAFQTARGHGWKCGWWNVELWIKRSGEVIVTEINSRAATVWSGIYERFGCSHYLGLLRVGNGEIIPKDDTPHALSKSMAAAQFHVVTFATARAGDLMDYEAALAVPGIEIFYKEGAMVEQTRGSGAWLARFELSGDNHAVLKKKADEIRRSLILQPDSSPWE